MALKEREEFFHGIQIDVSTAVIQDMCTGMATARYPFLAAASEMSVVSADAADAAAGTGAQTLELNILDATFNSTTVVVTMDGVTPVVIPSGPWYRVNGMRIKTAGSGEVAAGAITLTADTGGAVMSNIPAGAAKDGYCIVTIPSDEIIAFHGWVLAIYNAKNASDLLVGSVSFRRPAETWNSQQFSPFLTQSDPQFSSSLFGMKFDVGTDIRVSCIADAALTDAFANIAYSRNQRTGAL